MCKTIVMFPSHCYAHFEQISKTAQNKEKEENTNEVCLIYFIQC